MVKKMKPKIEVTVGPRYVGITTRNYKGAGVSVSLTWKMAVELADKLNAALDDPDEQQTARLLKRVLKEK